MLILLTELMVWYYFISPRVCLYGKLGEVRLFYDVDLGCVDTPNRAHILILFSLGDCLDDRLWEIYFLVWM